MSLVNTSNDLVVSKQASNPKGGGVLPFSFLSAVFSLLSAVVLMFIIPAGQTGQFFAQADLIYGSIMGLLSFGTYYFFYKSFSGSNTTVAVTIFRMNMVPGIILAILFTSEEITLKRSLAIIACVISIALFSSWNFREQKFSIHLVYSIIAMLMGALLNLFNKIGVRSGGTPSKMMLFRFLVVILVTAVVLTRNKLWTFSRSSIKFAAASGFLLVMSIYLFMTAVKTSDISVIQPITQLSITFVALISWLFYGEAMTAKKVLAILLAFSTVLLNI